MKYILILLFLLPTKTHKVSWYGGKFHGRKTASGEIYNQNKLTCAATKTYKLGTYLKVTNIENNKSVVVKVNDRGGFKKYGRTLDLSRQAFKNIAKLSKGVIKVRIEKVNK